MFDKYFERCCVLAGKVFLKDGHHMNIIGFGWDTSGHTAIMGFPEYSDEIRNDLTNVLKKALDESRDETGAEGQPSWYVQTAETWTLRVKTLEEYQEGGKRPSEHPDKMEAMVVQGSHQDGTSKMWLSEIHRDPNLHLGEPETSEGPKNQGLIAHALWGWEVPSGLR